MRRVVQLLLACQNLLVMGFRVLEIRVLGVLKVLK